jgi:hypothetical protein
MSDGMPFPSRHGLQWQIVLVDPRLLSAAQRHLRASGPSHAIEEALKAVLGASALGEAPRRVGRRVH